MAKGDDTSNKPATEGTASQLPQQNQYLQGNAATDSEANTRWMNPDSNFTNTGISGGGGIVNGKPASQPVQDGTMLGQITAGSVGQYMPGGYDQNKWNDPNKHDPKYDVGRILSKYPPSPAGLKAAMAELGPMGYTFNGKDKITGPGVGTIDVGYAFGSGDPNQMKWGWMPDSPGMPSGNQPGNSMFGQQQGNNNNFLQQMFQQLMAQRQQYANQQFNPTGGNASTAQTWTLPSGQQIPWDGGTRGIISNPQPNFSSMPMTDQYGLSSGSPKGGV